MSKLLWYKVTDLRLRDHEPLREAFRNGAKVLVAFFIDNRWFQPVSDKLQYRKFSRFKEKFMYESLIDLSNNIKHYNGHLNIYFGNPEDTIPSIIHKYNIDSFKSS